MNQAVIRFEVVVSQLFAENAYLAYLDGRADCIVVDPGFDTEQMIRSMRAHELTPAAILNTHGHSDHIAGNAALKEAWPDCPLVIGRGDADKLTDPELNLSAPFGAALTSPPADRLVDAGEVIRAAGLELEVRETPGHSAGHVVFVLRQMQPWVVFGGDVVFQGSIGRTDFPDGSMEVLERSIRTQLYDLPDDTVILPGHGPQTTVGQEKRTNPFVRG